MPECGEEGVEGEHHWSWSIATYSKGGGGTFLGQGRIQRLHYGDGVGSGWKRRSRSSLSKPQGTATCTGSVILVSERAIEMRGEY